jgi:hypothetical protein
MTEIFIDPTKSNIAVQVTSQSLHALGFEILVFAPDGITIAERFTGDTKTFNPFSKMLNNPPAVYKGGYLSGTFTVISPDGTDYPFSILFVITQDDAIITPGIILSGTTINGNKTITGVFHLN